MIDVDALQERLAARAAGEVLVWSAAHERGDDAEAAARDLLETSPPPLSVIGVSAARVLVVVHGRGRAASTGASGVTPTVVRAHSPRRDDRYRLLDQRDEA